MTSSPLERARADVVGFAAALHERCGIDYRQYAHASFRRRVLRQLEIEGMHDLVAYERALIDDGAALARLLFALSSHATSLFRRPAFFRTLREQVIPVLRTYPSVSVWCAASATGEVAYALAIVLLEEGLYGRCRIYATDATEAALAYAKEGVYPREALNEEEYLQAGGNSSLARYLTVSGDRAAMASHLRERMVFAQHSLTSDASFNEFQLIVCRDALIYYNEELEVRALGILHESLCRLGVLGLGPAESLRLHPHAHAYEAVDRGEKVFRRVE